MRRRRQRRHSLRDNVTCLLPPRLRFRPPLRRKRLPAFRRNLRLCRLPSRQRPQCSQLHLQDRSLTPLNNSNVPSRLLRRHDESLHRRLGHDRSILRHLRQFGLRRQQHRSPRNNSDRLHPVNVQAAVYRFVVSQYSSAVRAVRLVDLPDRVQDCLPVHVVPCIRPGNRLWVARWGWVLQDQGLRLRRCQEHGRLDVPVRRLGVQDSATFRVE